jgi:hypothetical protein
MSNLLETLRYAALHARQMADAYRREGNSKRADERDADADHYELKAYHEEWRLAHLKPMEKAA